MLTEFHDNFQLFFKQTDLVIRYLELFSFIVSHGFSQADHF